MPWLQEGGQARLLGSASMDGIFPSTQPYDICIYFNITYIVILATCFDSYESSSAINIQELIVHIVLQFFMS